MYAPIRRDQVTGRVVAAMTTTPRRIELIEPVIDSLLNQSRSAKTQEDPWEIGKSTGSGKIFFKIPILGGKHLLNHIE